MDVYQEIGVDPLYRAYTELARKNNLAEPSSLALTGKVFKRYTMWSHSFSDCLLHSIYDSPKHSWQLTVFLKRNIHGIGRNRQGRPKTFMNYKVRNIMERANIRSTSGFYNAMKSLEDKKIIFFREERKRLYLNIFPLVWNLENEGDREKVREIVEREIEKINEEISAESS